MKVVEARRKYRAPAVERKINVLKRTNRLLKSTIKTLQAEVETLLEDEEVTMDADILEAVNRWRAMLDNVLELVRSEVVKR